MCLCEISAMGASPRLLRSATRSRTPSRANGPEEAAFSPQLLQQDKAIDELAQQVQMRLLVSSLAAAEWGPTTADADRQRRLEEQANTEESR